MASSSKTVRFGENIIEMSSHDTQESDEEYYEIFTSEAESFATSDEDDAEILQMALEGAYTCSPCKRSMVDPAERSSYLFYDKDLMDEIEENGEAGDLHVCDFSLCMEFVYVFVVC